MVDSNDLYAKALLEAVNSESWDFCNTPEPYVGIEDAEEDRRWAERARKSRLHWRKKDDAEPEGGGK